MRQGNTRAGQNQTQGGTAVAVTVLPLFFEPVALCLFNCLSTPLDPPAVSLYDIIQSLNTIQMFYPMHDQLSNHLQSKFEDKSSSTTSRTTYSYTFSNSRHIPRNNIPQTSACHISFTISIILNKRFPSTPFPRIPQRSGSGRIRPCRFALKPSCQNLDYRNYLTTMDHKGRVAEQITGGHLITRRRQ